MLGESAGDPVTLTSSSPSYTCASADLTPLFNAPDYWEQQDALLDIQQATRNIIWIKPDHIVVYDRAASTHTGLFKQFNLNFTTQPSIAGNTITAITPGGQNLFVQTLLPTNATINYVPVNSITTISQEEPTVGRVVIEDPSNPVTTRFLHVLEGADSNATPDVATHVVSSTGNAFEGATVRGVAVMFPVNVLSNNFTSVQQVTVTPGAGLVADSAGLLSFDNAGQTLSGAPRFLSALWSGSGLQLAGRGMANVTYSILTTTNLASANWATAGSVNADSNGNFQFIDTGTSAYRERFYRLSWP